ncbi:hypothetical protein C5167_031529 [Papaver somniferum]|uniref:Tetraspanin n=1 Tax=Papaver somniferum TaxID=3469 RepID=A0A4Y7K4I3_PAPSO|nr:tetraspanin-2-like [Papaver somniferum]RZC68273.1 hypothetical protein C5167_031529 [Papaver somniferum]
MGMSNKVTAILNFIALLCSIPLITSGIWLSKKADNQCVHLFRWPVLILGILLLIVSLAGFVGSYWNRQGLLAFYLFSMAALIVVLLILLIFAFVVTRHDGSYIVPGRGYKEYRVEGYSSWLRNYVTESENWSKVRSCLAQTDVCTELSQEYSSADHFFSAHISPLQSGCCKPPTICGFTYVNPTFWVNPANPTSDPDCLLWSNDQHQLCYGCKACQAGVLGNLRKEWRKANKALIITVVVLICVYIIGCSAYKNAQTQELFRRYKDGWA